MSIMALLELKNIVKKFPVRHGFFGRTKEFVHAVNDVTLSIEDGETVGLVGESGCGKTTLGKIILGILKPDFGRIELATNKIQVIFQDPYNSLDPKMCVRDILSEALILSGLNLNNMEKVLDLVKLPGTALKKYPHQFSGGERQRIAIARAVLTKPEFIVCDEPVSSLDVTIRLQILKLLKDIQKRLSATYLFISHDLRVVRYMCSRVAVMKDGKIVEEGDTAYLYTDPKHPYTKQLLSSVLDTHIRT